MQPCGCTDLHLHAVQALPESAKSLYADPTSLYNFGWSHGVEMLANGKPDRHKGSYYANPLTDVPTNDEALMKQYPAYCRPNIWPTEHLPEYAPAFKYVALAPSLSNQCILLSLFIDFHRLSSLTTCSHAKAQHCACIPHIISDCKEMYLCVWHSISTASAVALHAAQGIDSISNTSSNTSKDGSRLVYYKVLVPKLQAIHPLPL